MQCKASILVALGSGVTLCSSAEPLHTYFFLMSSIVEDTLKLGFS